METVKVTKSVVIGRITKNRDRHRDIFERAMTIYRQKAIERLEDVITALQNGDTPSLIVHLPVPEDHTKDYNAVLDMLDLSVDDEVEISQRDFRCYVRDEWDWKQKFLGTVNSYVVDG